MVEKTENNEVVLPYRRRERRQEAFQENNPPAPTPENEVEVENESLVTPPEGKNKKEETFEKRYNDLRSFADKKISELVAEKKALLERVKGGDKGQAIELPATEAELTDFAAKYPDFWRIMATYVTKATQDKVAYTEAEVEALMEKQRKLEQKEALVKIREAHPDFDKIGEEDAFHEFLEEKEQYQKYFYEFNTDAESAIDAIDLYKVWKQKKYPSKPQKNERPKSDGSDLHVDTRSKILPEGTPKDVKMWRTSEIKRLKPQEFEKLEQELELAAKEGRIIRDTP